jgi:serine phosphatase RsbU (regulator of sigma subunit)
VLDVSRALGGSADLENALGKALDGLVTAFPGAESGFILTAELEGPLQTRAVHRKDGSEQTPAISRTVLAQVLDRGQALWISDPESDPAFTDAPSVHRLCTALCAPLPNHEGEAVGMIQLENRGSATAFVDGDLELLSALAVPIGAAVENHRMLRERASWEVAREIQSALLPRRRPDIPGYTFWEYYRPAMAVGGDLYDYIPVDPRGQTDRHDRSRWVVAVGDVSGKGVPAALLMASTGPEIRHLARGGNALPEVAMRVNRSLCDRELHARFVTMMLVEVDTRAHRLTAINAGHMPMLVRRANGTIVELGSDVVGLPLGIEPEEEYVTFGFALEPGDVALLYSDGVTDAPDRERRGFGRERLREVLAQAPPGVAAAGKAIAEAVRDHASGRVQFDDITLVCFGRDGETTRQGAHDRGGLASLRSPSAPSRR